MKFTYSTKYILILVGMWKIKKKGFNYLNCKFKTYHYYEFLFEVVLN